MVFQSGICSTCENGIFFAKAQIEIVPQAVAQFQPDNLTADNQMLLLLFSVPWGHHRYIIDKCSDVNQAIFYLNKTVQNNWSRDTLLSQIKQNLYTRQGKAITNFE